MYKKKAKKVDINIFALIFIGFIFLSIGMFLLYGLKLGIVNNEEFSFIQISKEMKLSKHNVTPIYLNRFYFNHMFLFHAIQNVFVKIFGVSLSSYRIPTVIFSFLQLIVVVFFVGRTFSLVAAILSVSILLLTPIYFHYSHIANQNVFCIFLFNIFMISMLFGYQALTHSAKFHNQQIKNFSPWYLFGFLCLLLLYFSCGIKITLFALIIVITFFWWQRNLEYLLGNYTFLFGILLLIFAFLAWSIFLIKGYGSKVALESFYGQFSFGSSSFKSGFLPKHPFLFTIPWIVFVIPAMISIYSNEHSYKINAFSYYASMFLLWWIISPIVLNLLFGFNIQLLLLIISVPSAILLSIWFHGLLHERIDSLGFYVGVVLLLIFYLYTMLSFMITGSIFGLSEIKFSLVESVILFAIFVGLSMVCSSYKQHISIALYIYFMTLIILGFSLSGVFLPKYFAVKDKYSKSTISMNIKHSNH